MSHPHRFGAIGGTGWLGSALIRRALAAGVIDAEKTRVSSRSGGKGGLAGLEGISFTTDNDILIAESDVILLAIRPEDLVSLPAVDFSGKLVLSVMAMLSGERLSQHLGTSRIIRAMPNAAAEFGQSYTPLHALSGTTTQDLDWAQAFFGASGVTEQVEDEGLIDYLTGLTGAGPAFFAALAAAMERDAVKRGMTGDAARKAINQLVKGAAPMLADAGPSMQALVDRFLEYRGTTAAGLEAMQAQGLDKVIHAMLAAAEAKARQGL